MGNAQYFTSAEGRSGFESAEGVSGFALSICFFVEVREVVIIRGPLLLHNINITKSFGIEVWTMQDWCAFKLFQSEVSHT